MSSVLHVPSVPELWKTFESKPSSYPISTEPTSTEIALLRLETQENLKRINCYQPGTEHSGWLWILLNTIEWEDMLVTQHNIDRTDAAAMAALEPLPTTKKRIQY